LFSLRVSPDVIESGKGKHRLLFQVNEVGNLAGCCLLPFKKTVGRN
jgi:hypothetical protein